MAFVRLEGAWVTAAGLAGQVAAVTDGRVLVDLSASARAAGLRPGMGERRARRQIPGLALVRRDAIDPLAALEPFYRLLARLSPRVEPAVESLAAWMEPDSCGSAADLAAALRAGGAGRWGHRLIVGIGHGRLVARLAARAAEAGRGRGAVAGGRFTRRGVVVVAYEVLAGEEAAFLAPLPVAVLQEVPPRVRRELVRMGLQTLGDVAAAPREVVARATGRLAPVLQAWCRGDDWRPLTAGFPPPQVEVARSAPPELSGDGEALSRWWAGQLPAMARRLAAELDRRGEAGTHLVLAGERASVRRRWPAAPIDGDGLVRLALGLYGRLLREEPAPGRLRLAATGLRPAARQLALPVDGGWGAQRLPAAGEWRARRLPVEASPASGVLTGLGPGETCASPPGRAAVGSCGTGLLGSLQRGADPELRREAPGRSPIPVASAPPAGNPGEPLRVLVAELGRRYPGRIFWGRERPASRRERQLAFWDPWRGLAGFARG